jgi:hypothetical protein
MRVAAVVRLIGLAWVVLAGLVYDARRRRVDCFADVVFGPTFVGAAFASPFRSRLALSVAIRSVVAGRASTSTRSISSPATFCSIAFSSRFRYSSS